MDNTDELTIGVEVFRELVRNLETAVTAHRESVDSVRESYKKLEAATVNFFKDDWDYKADAQKIQERLDDVIAFIKVESAKLAKREKGNFRYNKP